MALNVEVDFGNVGGAAIKQRMAIDSKWIVIGFRTGHIQVFQRKNLKQEKVFHVEGTAWT